MTRLMNANLSRLGINNIFRLALLGCAAAGAICPWSGWQLSRNSSGMTSGYCADYCLFSYSVAVAVAVALFCGYFTGTEYSDGTMRNKISAGDSRIRIYLSFFFTNALAACVLYTAYLIADAPLARIFLGPLRHFDAGDIAQLLICAYLLMIALAAVVTLLALVITNGAIFLCACLGMILASFLLGIYHVNILSDTILWQAVGGMRRTRVLFFLNFLPGGQLAEYYTLTALPEKWNGPVMLGGSALFIGVSTMLGLLLFGRKDLK